MMVFLADSSGYFWNEGNGGCGFHRTMKKVAKCFQNSLKFLSDFRSRNANLLIMAPLLQLIKYSNSNAVISSPNGLHFSSLNATTSTPNTSIP